MGQPEKKEEMVLQYIISVVGEKGYAPSVRDICRDLDIRSTSSVHTYLHRLAEKGYIEQEEGKRRTLRLTGAAGGLHRVPLLGNVTAGTPILAVENFDGYVDFAVDPAKYRPGELFALRVRGESMIDAGILDGDTVIVRKTEVAEDGQIVVALLGDEATVKTFYREGRRYRLQPENPTMAPIYTDELIILGRVIASCRFYENKKF